MNDEIRIKVMKKLDGDYPGEMEIYRRWERCIEMYTVGYHSVPRSIDKILEKIDLEQHSSDDFIAANGLWTGLRITNRATAHGACLEWLRSVLYDEYEPQYYALMELLWCLAPRTEEQRLEIAKQDFLNRNYGSSPECDMKYYGIDRDTLDAWTSELSRPQPEAKPALLRPEKDLRIGAVELLTERCSDEQGAFHNVNESLEFYDLGCQDAISVIVQNWIDTYYTDDVRKLFAQINTALLVGHSANSIRESLLPSAPEASYRCSIFS